MMNPPLPPTSLPNPSFELFAIWKLTKERVNWDFLHISLLSFVETCWIGYRIKQRGITRYILCALERDVKPISLECWNVVLQTFLLLILLSCRKNLGIWSWYVNIRNSLLCSEKWFDIRSLEKEIWKKVLSKWID